MSRERRVASVGFIEKESCECQVRPTICRAYDAEFSFHFLCDENNYYWSRAVLKVENCEWDLWGFVFERVFIFIRVEGIRRT